jgi:hypothetical protein
MVATNILGAFLFFYFYFLGWGLVRLLWQVNVVILLLKLCSVQAFVMVVMYELCRNYLMNQTK